MLHSLGRIGKKKTEPAPQQSAEPPQQPAGEPTYADKVHAATHDHAKDILWNHMSVHGGITKAAAAYGWDAYFNATSAEDLAKRLQSLPLPDVTKHELYLSFKEHREKPKTSNWRDKLDKVVAAIHTIGSKKLSIAHVEKGEQHPHVMRALTDAAMKEHDEDK